jgi:hypothetical protein
MLYLKELTRLMRHDRPVFPQESKLPCLHGWTAGERLSLRSRAVCMHLLPSRSYFWVDG